MDSSLLDVSVSWVRMAQSIKKKNIIQVGILFFKLSIWSSKSQNKQQFIAIEQDQNKKRMTRKEGWGRFTIHKQSYNRKTTSGFLLIYIYLSGLLLMTDIDEEGSYKG